MALIAILAVVDIPADALVLLIGLRLQVAARAGEHRIVVGVRVAVAANAVGVAMVHREPGVIKRGIGPKLGVVTRLTSRREMRGHVVGVVCVQIVLLVAAVAIGRQVGPVVVDVTVGALPRRNGMRSGQGECRVVVIELAVSPGDCVVAKLARLREPDLRVRRIIRVLVILQVAGDARRLVQFVIVVDVAVATSSWRHGMRPGQRPAGRGMIELAIGPHHRVVAGLAG